MLKEDMAEILIIEEELQARVAELGKTISVDYQGKDLLVVCILEGRSFSCRTSPGRLPSLMR